MHGSLSSEEVSILRRLPSVSRARGCRLYTADGLRWTDCWADDGRALAGHRPDGLSLRLKSEISRGLYAPYTSPWEHRLQQALFRLFPGYTAMRLFHDARDARDALRLKNLPADPLDLDDAGKDSDVLWGRPCLPNHPQADILFPILPFPGLASPQPVLFADDGMKLPESRAVSALLLAGLSRLCAVASKLELPENPQTADIWERRGPYMMYRGNAQNYRECFEYYFSRRILISPSLERPSIYPHDLSGRDAELLRDGPA